MIRIGFMPMLLLLAACASPGASTTSEAPSSTQVAPERMLATIRAAAGSEHGELAVVPLRDAAVEHHRQRAQTFEDERRYRDAAAELDHALQVLPDDPGLLQERAEMAVALGDYTQAETLARRAWQLGSQVGPLCRRHWATVRQARYAARDGAAAAHAQQQLQACTVGPPPRY